MKKNNIPIIILCILFILNTILVCTNQIKIIDDGIYQFLMNSRNSRLDTFLINITKFGNVLTIIGIIIVLLVLLPKKEKYLVLINSSITVIINNILKYSIRRPRPSHIRLIKQGGYSYPSGHAMISIAVYGLLIYFICHKSWNRWLKVSLIVLLTLLIISIGISRIYVGVHYPSDIIGGYLLALLIEIEVIERVDNYLGGISDDKNGRK